MTVVSGAQCLGCKPAWTITVVAQACTYGTYGYAGKQGRAAQAQGPNNDQCQYCQYLAIARYRSQGVGLVRARDQTGPLSMGPQLLRLSVWEAAATTAATAAV